MELDGDTNKPRDLGMLLSMLLVGPLESVDGGKRKKYLLKIIYHP